MTFVRKGKLEETTVPNCVILHAIFQLYLYICIDNIALAKCNRVPERVIHTNLRKWNPFNIYW